MEVDSKICPVGWVCLENISKSEDPKYEESH